MANYTIIRINEPITSLDLATIEFCKEDILECVNLYSTSLIVAVASSIKHSEEAYIVERNGKACAVFGISVVDTCGIPWFVSDGKLTDIRKTFLKSCRCFMKQWESNYLITHMQQKVWIKHQASRKLLQFLGFSPAVLTRDSITYVKDLRP